MERAAARSSALMRVALAHHWQKLLDEEQFESMTEIAAAEEMDLGHVKIARLVYLAPNIVDACLAEDVGGIALEHVARGASLLDWSAQRQTWPSDGDRQRYRHSHLRQLFVPATFLVLSVTHTEQSEKRNGTRNPRH